MQNRLNLTLAVLLGAALAAIVAMQVGDVHAETVVTKGRHAEETTRACAWTSGTVIACSAGVAYSAQLGAATRYAVQAVSGAVYFRQTLAASGGASKTTDLEIPTGAWLELSTVNGRRYISCDGSDNTATLRYMECQ